MKIFEVQHQGEPLWLHRFGNWSAIDSDSVHSLFALAWLFKEDGKWIFTPRACGSTSLFYNAVLFVRIASPFGIFASVRWSGSTSGKSILQAGIGWKLNGRLAILFRIQSDQTSAQGVTGPNSGQATGFDFGTH